MEISQQEIERSRKIICSIRDEVAKKVVGQEQLLDALIITLVSRGHILLESVPGLAKTLAVSSLAAGVSGSFARVQCTPDLLPSDIIGTQIFDAQNSRFTTELGPVHNNFVLLDEINRSSAKTQSAMLEAMQERQTSIGGQSYQLPNIFMVMATQNPIEEEGTYVLPQAQMDRFLLKEIITYPKPNEEIDILNRLEQGILDDWTEEPTVCLADIEFLQRLVKGVHVSNSIKSYIVELVNVSRNPGYFIGEDQARYLEYGASPRGSIAFIQVARANALLNNRNFVIPEDVKRWRYSVLRHRMIMTFEAVAEKIPVEQLIDSVFDTVPVP